MQTKTLLALVAVLAASTSVHARTVGIQLHDNPLHIAPETLLAQPGETLDILVINQGSSPHNLILCDVASRGGCANPLAFTPLLESRQNATLNATFLTAGTYAYHCDLPGHSEGGMNGEVQVQAQAKPSPGLAVPLLLCAVLAAAAILRRT